MGQLIVGIREAEERLAAIGRALQSAYEEEIREATLARDTASQGVARAQAMEAAARSLGQTDIGAKIVEVIASLRNSEAAAIQRLAELAALEKAVQLRLTEPERTPGPASLTAGVPLTAASPMLSIPPSGMSSMPPGASATPSTMPPGTLTPSTLTATPGPETPPLGRDELLARQEQLIARIDELDRVARRWPIDIARCGIQEHVALARLIGRRFEGLGRQAESRIPTAIQRLQALAAAVGADGLSGFDGEIADWARIASDARSQRLALVEARRRGAAA